MATSQSAASWLFIKGQETIWLLRSERDHLVICGPGACREHFRFDGETAMESFQVTFAEGLMAGGWILWGIDRDRRTGPERRGAARDTADRRLSARAGDPDDPSDWH